MRLCFASIASLLLAVSTTSPAMAAPIAEFTFPQTTDSPPPQPGYNPNVLVPNVQVTGIMVGSGLLSGATLEITNIGSYPDPPVLRVGASSSTNLTGSVNNNSYFQFTVEPDDGWILNLESLSLDAARGGGSTPRGYAVFSSEIGFALGDQIFGPFDIPTERSTFTNTVIDLTDPVFAGIFQGLTEPTTFRFNIYSPSSGSTIEFDNIVLSGFLTEPVIIPEPSSLLVWSLIGVLGLAGTCAWRRNRSAP